ncbi:calcium-binding protein [Nocardioides sp. YIM 152315]|uniref:calcium-binding protein n=1 Tax=Nocardioides sp. YIM 152315 TaxID=3031760 RepID=UPI0023DC6382|nr:calcium-binding protein [Nocardioides sp. YIM 152315]MDF1605292.1 calcium-binding protein [Nocardioides sp. YIM 152315]
MSTLGGHARPSRHVVLTAAATLVVPLAIAWSVAPAGAAPGDVLCQGKKSDKIATAAGQTITGTDQRDVLSANGFTGVQIVGLDGDDVLCGSPSGSAAAPAVVRGGPGADAIEAGPGVRIHGGAGNDAITGASAVIHGDAGNDQVHAAGGGGTFAYGDEGNDSLDSTGGDDQHLFGNEGDDQLSAPGGSGHVLTPGAGNDVVSGPPTATLDYNGHEPVTFDVAAGTAIGQGSDTFSGLRRFDGGTGADVFLGTGDVEYYSSVDAIGAGTPGVDAVWTAGGDDHVTVSFGDVHAGAGADYVRILGGAAAGNSGKDTLIASYQGTLEGGSGKDLLRGEVDLTANLIPVGGFVFRGGEGRDRIRLPYPTLAAGAVTACGALPTCTSTAKGGPGVDLLDLRSVHGRTKVNLAGRGKVSYRFGRSTARDFERVQGSRGTDRIRGNAAANRIDGNGGADRIWGRAGRDVLIGGAGRDRLVGGPGHDITNGGPGRDECRGGARRRC